MKIVELVIDELDELAGIEAISVVENPAIEEDFIALKNQEEIKLAELDKEKKILLGPLLIPNKPIFRKSGDDEYYIYFSRETVRKASEGFLMKGNQSKSTLEHQHSIKGERMIDVMLSKATEGMLIAELLNRRNDKEVPLFMGKSILLPNGQQQLLAILPNIQILTTVEQEEE